MGYLKVSPGLFLESAELSRLKEFLDNKGFRMMTEFSINKPGIIPNKSSESSTNFLITQDGVNEAILVPGLSYAINADTQIITQREDLSIPLARSSDPHWIYVSHEYSPLEKGTVVVDGNGNMSGSNTKFLEVLRGQPNFSTKIVFFTDSFSDTEYEVLRVMSDTTAILQGDFQTGDFPAGTKYAVVGTFDYDSSPLESSKRIYQYDSCIITVVNQATQPVLTDGYDFLLASVVNNSGVLSITDLREEYFLEMKGNIDTSNIALLNKENIFSKYQSWNQSLVVGSKSANSSDKNLLLSGADTGFIEINMSSYDGAYLLEGLLKEENTPYNIGAILILKITNLPSTIYWSYPYDSVGFPVGFEDYSALVKNSGGAQISGRPLAEGDILIVQQISYSWASLSSCYKTRWRILTNLYSDTKDLYEKINNLITQVSKASTTVFVSGVGGITDTDDADSAGAQEGDIFIS